MSMTIDCSRSSSSSISESSSDNASKNSFVEVSIDMISANQLPIGEGYDMSERSVSVESFSSFRSANSPSFSDLENNAAPSNPVGIRRDNANGSRVVFIGVPLFTMFMLLIIIFSNNHENK